MLKDKDRIKKIRKELDLTQQKFADRLGVKRNTVGQWECGINALTDQTITAICREFKVNENWLRDGIGEMFVHISRDEQIATFIGGIQMDEKNNSFKKKLISVLANLTEEQWEILADISEKLSNEKDQD